MKLRVSLLFNEEPSIITRVLIPNYTQYIQIPFDIRINCNIHTDIQLPTFARFTVPISKGKYGSQKLKGLIRNFYEDEGDWTHGLLVASNQLFINDLTNTYILEAKLTDNLFVRNTFISTNNTPRGYGPISISQSKGYNNVRNDHHRSILEKLDYSVDFGMQWEGLLLKREYIDIINNKLTSACYYDSNTSGSTCDEESLLWTIIYYEILNKGTVLDPPEAALCCYFDWENHYISESKIEELKHSKYIMAKRIPIV